MRVEIAVDGFITDFGRLSARNVVSDANGKASVTYTAPAPVFGITSTVNVDILVTPSESDFGNATARSVTIHVVPTGIIGPPSSPFIPNFAPPTATVGNLATFDATVTGSSTTSAVATFVWDFGDNDSEVGQTVQHRFAEPGTYLVTLGLIDTLGRTNSVSKSVTVGQGTVPTADIIASPTSPAVGQTVNFSGAGSTAEPGHQIVDYSWNFGDGTLGSGQLVQHAYQASGEYTVTLKVTDEVGRKSVLKSFPITVGGTSSGGSGTTQASFSISPPNPTGKTGDSVLVLFDGSGSTASSGGSIVSYVWTFDSGGSATGQQTQRTFVAPGSYQVTLTVTDSKGKTNSKTQPFTVTGT
jgi:PKD repeat protein